MVIRPARYQDIKGLIRLGEEAYAMSVYGALTLDTDAAKRALMGAITGTNTAAFVADDGEIKGAIIGAAVQLYESLDATEVTDRFWYVTPGAPARTGLGLLHALEGWAKDTFGGRILMRPAVHSAIADPSKVAKLLQRDGYAITGYVLEKEI